MRHVPLAKAPLAFAAHAYRGQALFRFLAPVQLLWLFEQTRGSPDATPIRIDPDGGWIVITPFDPAGSRIEVDLVDGSARLVLRRSRGKRMQDVEAVRGTVPFVLSKADEYPSLSYLFGSLSDLWSHLCRALQDAHLATPRIVDIRGRREGDRQRSVLSPEFWNHEPAWDENAVYLPRPGRRQGDTSSRERCGSVTVTYLGERRRPAAKVAIEREIAAFRMLVRAMNAEPRADPPIKPGRRGEFFARALEEVPQLRRAEFERCWIAATLVMRAVRQREHLPSR